MQIMCKCLRFPQKPTDCHKFHNELTDLISFRFSDLEIIRNISRIYFFKDKKNFFVPNSYIFVRKVCLTQNVFVCLSLYLTTMFLIMLMTKTYFYSLFQML